MRGNATGRLVRCPACRALLTVANPGATSIRCAICKETFPATTAIPVERPKPGVAAGVCILAVIGLVMAFQPVSLLTGTGTAWIGVAMVGAGTAAAFFLRAPLWVRIVTCVVLGLALFNVLAVEHQVSEKRDEIGRVLRQ